jgi:hypothetical protein
LRCARDLALADDGDPVREDLDLRQDVRRQEYRAAGRLRLADAILEHRFHEGVQAGGRLVEQQQLDVAGERGDQGDLLPVALGVGASLLGRVEAEAFDQVVAAFTVELAAQPCEQVDRFAPREVGPQLDIAGHIGKPAVQLHRIGPWIPA